MPFFASHKSAISTFLAWAMTRGKGEAVGRRDFMTSRFLKLHLHALSRAQASFVAFALQ
jgi:hypothetical protein